MAWLIFAVDRISRKFGYRFKWKTMTHLYTYMALKWLMMGTVLCLDAYLFGLGPALFLALCYVLVWMFDYWCVYAEALTFLLALTGSLPLALLACMLGPLSRESTLLAPAIYFFVTGDFVGSAICTGVWLAIYLLKKKWVGNPPWYTDRFTLKTILNWRAFLASHPGREPYFAFAIFFVIMSMALLPGYHALPVSLEQTAWVVPTLILMGGFLTGFLWEPRVFINVAIWIGPLLLLGGS